MATNDGESTSQTPNVDRANVSAPLRTSTPLASDFAKVNSEITYRKLDKELHMSKLVLAKTLGRVLAFNPDNINVPYVSSILDQSMKSYHEIIEKQSTMVECIYDYTSEDKLGKLIDTNLNYQFSTLETITNLKENLLPAAPAVTAAAAPITVAGTSNRPPSIQLKLPEIKINNFSDNENNCFAYHQFKSSFNNALGAFPDLTDAHRLIYLKSSLSGRALSLVENLVVSDQSYADAVRVLDSEFLDRESIFNKIVKDLIAIKPMESLDNCNDFIVKMKSQILELSKINYEFMRSGTSGNELISHIIRSKLPRNIIVEISRRSSVTYPKIQHIFEHFFEIKKVFTINKVEKSQSTSSQSDGAKKISTNQIKDNSNSSSSRSSTPRFESNSDTPKGCKLCRKTNHGTSKCTEHPSYSDRVRQARLNGLCTRCLSSTHDETKCHGLTGKLKFPCTVCHKAEHVTPLCPENKSSPQR